MSVSANFYKLSKRKNSTKQPTGTGTTYNVDLKSGTSLLSPTLLLSNSGKPDFNYFSFEGMYYFIRDIVSVRNDLWEIYGEVDALATGKANILSTTAYVLYDSVANTEIPDNRLPFKTTKSVQASSAACPFTVDSGCYILSITGSHNSTGVYKCDFSDMAALIDDISDIEDNLFTQQTPPDVSQYSGVDGYIEYIGDTLVFTYNRFVRVISQFFGSSNIPENIRQCIFIPFNRGTTYGPTSPVYLGTFETNISLSKLNTDTVVGSTSVSIPWQASDYRRRSPYTEIYLYLPYIGMTKLSSENLIGQSSINVSYTLSMRDGSMIVTVTSGSQVLGQYSCNVGVSVPIGISSVDLPRAAQSVISGITSAAADSLGGVGMAALNFTQAITPNFTCIGGLDGQASTAASQNITCYTVFHDTVAAPNSSLSDIGSPTMAPKSLAALTGYCQCLGAHVEGAFPKPVLDKIDGFLNSGFFIE